MEGSILGKVWNAPNTIIGGVVGVAGLPFGAQVTIGNNAIQFTDHPFMYSNGAITIGNTILYGKNVGPNTSLPNCKMGEHELQHTLQAEELGPLYLPSNILGGVTATITDGNWHGKSNWNERGPQDSSPSPW